MLLDVQKLHLKRFDVVVIGGGINGSSAAQNLAAAGYSCLIVDKGDFGSGASGRSSRMLHIGLRFFEAPDPVRHFGLRPRLFLDALRSARQAIQAVGEHLETAGDRIWPYRMCFPVYEGAAFKSWHLNAGLKLLQTMGGRKVALQPETIRRDFSAKIPFFDDFRDIDRISAVSLYNEFKFDWPERFCIDMVLDAERNGAVVLNHCRATLGARNSEGDWEIALTAADDSTANCLVRAPIVLNMAGTWIDDLLPDTGGKLIHATKGAHLIVEMPDRYRGFGIASLNSLGLPFYVLPLRGNVFSIGVTETPFDGDATDIAATDDEIDFLIAETNALLPGRDLSRRDVLRTWAGVRPLTSSRSAAKAGRAPRTLHDLENRGLPGVFALTGGPIMTHRSAGRMVVDAVSRKLKPTGQRGQVDVSPFAFSDSANSPPFLDDALDVRLADLEHGVQREHARTLEDLLVRRTDLAWRRNLSRQEVARAAEIAGIHLDWSAEERSAAVERFMSFQSTVFRTPGQTGRPQPTTLKVGKENHPDTDTDEAIRCTDDVRE